MTTIMHLAGAIGTRLGLNYFDLTDAFNENVNKVCHFANENITKAWHFAKESYTQFADTQEIITTDQPVLTVDLVDQQPMGNTTAASIHEMYTNICSFSEEACHFSQECHKEYPWILPLTLVVTTWSASNAAIKKGAAFISPSAKPGFYTNGIINFTSLMLATQMTRFAFEAAGMELNPEEFAPLVALIPITVIGLNILGNLCSWGSSKFKATPLLKAKTSENIA